MSDETTGMLDTGNMPSPVYTTTYVVDLGKHQTGLSRRSGCSGRAVVEVSESGLILRCRQGRSALWVLLVSVLLWLAVFTTVVLESRTVLRWFAFDRIVFELPMLLAVYVFVRIFAGRQLVDVHLDPCQCTAHYFRERGCVVVETPKGEWIDMTPLPANEARFLADVRRCFGDQFVADAEVVVRSGRAQLVSPPRSMNRAAISVQIRESLARQTGQPEREVSEALPLASDGLDVASLLVAVKADYDVDLTPAEIESAGMVKDLIDVVYRKLHQTSG